VLVVVHTADADILLLRRRAPFEFWQSVTGSLERNESAAAAARRELLEETGLSDEGELVATGVTRSFTIDPRWRDRYPAGVSENTEHEWRYRLPARRDIAIDAAEHSAYRWVPLAEAASMVWSATNRQALLDLAASLP